MDINHAQPSSPPQDTHQPGFQQHGHPGGAEEEGLPAKSGETPLQEQHHASTELPAAADARHERIAGLRAPLLVRCSGAREFYAMAT